MNTRSCDIVSDAPLEYQNSEVGAMSRSFHSPAPLSPEDVGEAALLLSLAHDDTHTGFGLPGIYDEELPMTSEEDKPTQVQCFFSPPAPRSVVRPPKGSERTSKLRLVESI